MIWFPLAINVRIDLGAVKWCNLMNKYSHNFLLRIVFLVYFLTSKETNEKLSVIVTKMVSCFITIGTVTIKSFLIFQY